MQPHKTPLIPREILLGAPERMNPKLSPDGKWVAWLGPDNGNVLQIWVRGVGEQAARIVTKGNKKDIYTYSWAQNNDTLIYEQDRDGDENPHLYGVSVQKEGVRDYTPFPGVRARILAFNPCFPDEMLIALNSRDPSLFDVFRVDLSTGAIVDDATNPGDVAAWVVDANFQVRAAIIKTSSGGVEIRIREGVTSFWRTWMSAAPEDILSLVDFSEDGKSAFLISSIGRDTAALVERNIESGTETIIAASDKVDVGPILIHPQRHVVQAVAFVIGRTSWMAVDRTVANDFAQIANLSDGDFYVISRDSADNNWLVAFTRDRGAVHFYVWNRKVKKGEFLFSHQPSLDQFVLSEMQPITYTARDGMRLYGYLTLPVGVAKERLPMVLLVHGGPWARDFWGFNGYVQWLANRGYAVLQINFRGSSGYGKRYLNAGNRQWGLKMQDDLIDGARWATSSGIADSKRLAVFGVSYGGYAALAAAAFTPEEFACCVDMAGPSNLKTMVAAIPKYWKPIRAAFDYRIGNVDDPKDADLIRNASPLFRADRINKPLLIGQGANDPRVNIRESEQIVDAITKSGGAVTYVVYPDEGHILARHENRIDFMARAEKFLATYLHGRCEAMTDDRIPGSSAIVKTVGSTRGS